MAESPRSKARRKRRAWLERLGLLLLAALLVFSAK